MAAIDYLIIGGGVAGTAAAETIRQRDPAGSIAIVSDEPHRLYSRIMLSKPNFFLEKISFEQVWLKTEAWYAQHNIQLLAGREAKTLDPAQKVVGLDDGSELFYARLLLALGGRARRWAVPGADKRGVLYLRTLDEAKALITAVKTAKSAATPRAITIGGGFISFEMCELMRLAGLEVTVLVREPVYWGNRLDKPSGRLIEAALEGGGVKIVRSAEAAQVLGDTEVEGVMLTDGTRIPCQLILVGVGIVVNLDWVSRAGIEVAQGVVADEYLETNIPDIWTAGDCAEFEDLIVGDRVQLGNWVNAQMQGRAAGLNMVAASKPALGVQRQPFKMVSFYTTQGFGITIVFTGDVRTPNGRQVIARGSAELGWYVRLIVKDGEVVGATLINRTPELGTISKLIKQNVNITGFEEKLGDPGFDLKSLLQNSSEILMERSKT